MYVNKNKSYLLQPIIFTILLQCTMEIINKQDLFVKYLGVYCNYVSQIQKVSILFAHHTLKFPLLRTGILELDHNLGFM